uniref:Putative secreted peptide n=1 Tax=Anopheles braziliensis TaxID=58242 RepID=A0A2M3ZS42_9DIPT
MSHSLYVCFSLLHLFSLAISPYLFFRNINSRVDWLRILYVSHDELKPKRIAKRIIVDAKCSERVRWLAHVSRCVVSVCCIVNRLYKCSMIV